MGMDVFARLRARATVTLAAFLLAALAVGLYRWIAGSTPGPLMSEAADAMEGVLDRQILVTVADFRMWSRLNIAVQCATILLGLTATLLTASTTPANTERLKIATVSVTALTAALVGVQSTFHLRENIQTDATAFSRITVLETEYIYGRNHLAELKTTLAALHRDTVQKLARISSDRMMALANIGTGTPPPAGEAARPGPAD